MTPAQPARSLPEEAPLPEARPLCDLAPAARAIIDSVDATAAIAGRLLDLGFIPGTPVTVIRRAPLGDPVVYELRGYRICLRRSEASHIWVRPG
jgi:ferrous iron transport protein A